MIETCELTKVFPDSRHGAVHAVDRLTFRAEPGRIYGLLGANGAGKTTALRMLATLLRPSSGSAKVCGYDVATSPTEVRALVGFLAAGTALYGRLTARELIAYFGRLHGMDESTLGQRIGEIADELAMHEFLDRRCDKLSTGMRQRTAIARTIVHDPQVMIFDEPTLGLDVMTARTIVQFVRRCRERGRTIVYSTHVMAEAEKLCDTIGIIHRGRLVAEGSLADLCSQHGQSDLEEVFVKAVAGESEYPGRDAA
jgi:sodium transport system ATP-binding protein